MDNMDNLEAIKIDLWEEYIEEWKKRKS